MPQETVVYWTEYIARHKGAPHIKSAAQQLSFIEYHMIDVFGLMALITLFLSILFVCSCQCFYKKVFVRKNIISGKKNKVN